MSIKLRQFEGWHMVMLFRLNPDAVQILSSRTCAFIFRSRRFREGIIGKGGKMSGVGGISRARLHRVSLLRLCPSLFVSHTRAHIAAFSFFISTHPRAMHRVTRKTDGFACVFAFNRRWMHVDFPASCSPENDLWPSSLFFTRKIAINARTRENEPDGN